jgi:UDP-N-acetylmuramyl pentapeptide phosphotransferase/UDP-N-acetylglucosamine-1-phosphate transferase
LLYGLTPPLADAWATPLVFAAAALGFLVWNLPPARIFMGDVGSGFIGMSLAAHVAARIDGVAIAVLGMDHSPGVFIVDASMTLLAQDASRRTRLRCTSDTCLPARGNPLAHTRQGHTCGDRGQSFLVAAARLRRRNRIESTRGRAQRSLTRLY